MTRTSTARQVPRSGRRREQRGACGPASSNILELFSTRSFKLRIGHCHKNQDDRDRHHDPECAVEAVPLLRLPHAEPLAAEDMNPTCQSRKPSVSPATAKVLARLKPPWVARRRYASITAPIQHNNAVSASATMIIA